MSEAGVTQFNIRMPRDLIALVDVEVAKEKEAHPGRAVTRSDLIREAVYEFLSRRAEAPDPGSTTPPRTNASTAAGRKR